MKASNGMYGNQIESVVDKCSMATAPPKPLPGGNKKSRDWIPGSLWKLMFQRRGALNVLFTIFFICTGDFLAGAP